MWCRIRKDASPLPLTLQAGGGKATDQQAAYAEGGRDKCGSGTQRRHDTDGLTGTEGTEEKSDFRGGRLNKQDRVA